AVAVALVERAVDRVFNIRRQEVRVVDDERIARDGAVPGETGAVDGDRELDERRLGLRVRLRQPKAQPLRPLRAVLDEVQAAGVRLRDAARLGQDQVEQSLQVALGPQRDADARELADFARALRRFATRARGLCARRGFAEAGPNRDEQAARARWMRQESRQKLGGEGVGHVGFTVASQRDDGAAGVHEGAQHVQGERGAALGVEEKHRGPVFNSEIPRLRYGAGLYLRGRERRSNWFRP